MGWKLRAAVTRGLYAPVALRCRQIGRAMSLVLEHVAAPRRGSPVDRRTGRGIERGLRAAKPSWAQPAPVSAPHPVLHRRLGGEPVGCGGIAFEGPMAEVKRCMCARARPRRRPRRSSLAWRKKPVPRRDSPGSGDRRRSTRSDPSLQTRRFHPLWRFGGYATMPPAATEHSLFFEKRIGTGR